MAGAPYGEADGEVRALIVSRGYAGGVTTACQWPHAVRLKPEPRGLVGCALSPGPVGRMLAHGSGLMSPIAVCS